MSDPRILAKLRSAHIPPYAYQTTFDRESLSDLKARVTSKQVIEATSPINFYLYSGDSGKAAMKKTCLAVGLMAKTLCLSGLQVVHTTLAGFLREQRFAEMEREGQTLNPAIDCIGKGYIAIGDFLEYADVEQKYGYHSCQLAADYLLEHVERGGGLILGASNIPPRDVEQFGAAFSAMLDMFEAYRI